MQEPFGGLPTGLLHMLKSLSSARQTRLLPPQSLSTVQSFEQMLPNGEQWSDTQSKSSLQSSANAFFFLQPVTASASAATITPHFTARVVLFIRSPRQHTWRATGAIGRTLPLGQGQRALTRWRRITGALRFGLGGCPLTRVLSGAMAMNSER